MTDALVILRQVAYVETPDVEGRNGDGPPQEDPDAPDDDDGTEDEHDPDATPLPGGENDGAALPGTKTATL